MMRIPYSEKKQNVCVDVDCVLAEYDGWKGIENIGKPIKGAVEFTKKLAENFNVIIHTTRLDLKINEGWRYPELVSILEKWLEKHGFHWTDMRGKPLAVAYIDDRAVSCCPKLGSMAFEMAIGLANLEADNLKQKKWR